jgi:hypothetical protein
VLEDLLRHIGLLDAGDEPHLALTARTLQDIDAEDPLQQRGPIQLSTLFDAAALAEAPVHPHTDEVLRSTRAIERLSALATRLKDDERATTKVGCPACAKGHLTLRRSA